MRGQKISRSNLSPRRRGGQFGESRPEDFRRSDHPGARFARATPPILGGEFARLTVRA